MYLSWFVCEVTVQKDSSLRRKQSGNKASLIHWGVAFEGETRFTQRQEWGRLGPGQHILVRRHHLPGNCPLLFSPLVCGNTSSFPSPTQRGQGEGRGELPAGRPLLGDGLAALACLQSQFLPSSQHRQITQGQAFLFLPTDPSLGSLASPKQHQQHRKSLATQNPVPF